MGCFLTCFMMPEDVIKLINKTTQTPVSIKYDESDEEENFHKAIYGWE